MLRQLAAVQVGKTLHLHVLMFSAFRTICPRRAIKLTNSLSRYLSLALSLSLCLEADKVLAHVACAFAPSDVEDDKAFLVFDMNAHVKPASEREIRGLVESREVDHMRTGSRQSSLQLAHLCTYIFSALPVCPHNFARTGPLRSYFL